MGGSGLQWSFSGKPDSPSQLLSFKPSSEGGNHSIYAPGFVQVVCSEKPQNYGALAAKIGRLSSGNDVNGVSCRVNTNEAKSAVVGSTNLCGESSFNGPSQMTIFYNGLVCVYDDVAPDKAQAIMLLAGNGNSRSQKPAEPKAVNSLEPIQTESAPANPTNDSASADKIEVNLRNPAPKFSSHLSKSALAIDPVSSGSHDVSTKKPGSKLPTPSSNQIRFQQSVGVIDLDAASASTTSTVEASSRNPVVRYPSPLTGSAKTNRFRFSPSNVTIDPVLGAALTSSFDSLKTPANKFTPPATGSLVSNQFLERASNQFRFSQSAHASTGRIEASSSNPATRFSPPATGSIGSNQIRFSQSDAPVVANQKSSTSTFTPPSTGSNGLNHQIRFSRSAHPIDHGSAGAPISIVESNPIRPTAKFPDPATSSGTNQFRFPQSVDRNHQSKGIQRQQQNTISVATAKDVASARVSNSIAETKFSDPAASTGSNQLRFSHSFERHSAKPVSQITHSGDTNPASARALNRTVESNPISSTTKFSDSKTGAGSNQICFSQSGPALSNREKSVSGSSSSDLVKPVSPATPSATSSNVEASEAKAASKTQTPANGSGKPKELRFSQSGVPLARKASLARFLEKRKERPCDTDSISDFPPAKYRSNSE